MYDLLMKYYSTYRIDPLGTAVVLLIPQTFNHIISYILGYYLELTNMDRFHHASILP